MTLNTVGVVGLGAMGAGIAEVLARGGYTVIAVENNAQFLERGLGIVEKSLAKAVERGKLSANEAGDVSARIHGGTDRNALSRAQLVIEAIPENLAWKTELFTELDEIVPTSTILATNTSSLSITKLAEATNHPDRVLGIHFFNPAPVMSFVEVITTAFTSTDLAAIAFEFAKSLGKQPILIADRAGFVANYLLLGYLNNAANLLHSGRYSRDDIEASMKVGRGLPMGPMALMDLIGNDVSLPILETMYAETKRPVHEPSPLIVQLVRENKLGRKTGRGFFTYEQGKAIDAADGVVKQEIIDELWNPYLAEAIAMMREGYASADDIDLAMTKGCGYPIGPIAAATQAGLL